MSVAAGTGDSKPLPLRHVFAVSLGNALGFYDFLIYVYFAVYIGRAFFPAHNQTASLLATFGVTKLSPRAAILTAPASSSSA